MPRLTTIDTFKATARIRKARLVRVHILYQSRNEWINWDGDTSKVNRPVGKPQPTSQLAAEMAERMRAPGSSFAMTDSIALALVCDKGVVLVSQFHTNSPFRGLLAAMNRVGDNASFPALLRVLDALRFVDVAYHLDPAATPSYEPFQEGMTLYRRVAQAGGRKNSLAWAMKPYQVDAAAGFEVMALINQAVEAAKQGPKPSATNEGTATPRSQGEAVAQGEHPARTQPSPPASGLPSVQEPLPPESDSTPETLEPPPAAPEIVERRQVSLARVGQGSIESG